MKSAPPQLSKDIKGLKLDNAETKIKTEPNKIVMQPRARGPVTMGTLPIPLRR